MAVNTDNKKSTNPLDESDFSKLKTSIEWSQRQLEFPRRKRLEAIKAYAGYHYMNDGSTKIMPTNTLKMAVDVYVRQLAARAPRVMITTKRKELYADAANFELAINQIPDEIKLNDTLREFVTESLFSPFGALKIGLSAVGSVLSHTYGKVFVDNITFDDFFIDMSAKDIRLIQYCGNDYWLDYEDVMESDWVEKKSRKDLKPDAYEVVGPAGEKRADSISNSSSADVYKDRIWLRDVWLPSEKLLVTYGIKSGKLLNTVEWDGPKCGPYIKLGHHIVPGNLLNLSPVSSWRDLNELENGLFRKLGKQADSEKTVQGFSGGDDAGVTAFKNAEDGSGIKYNGSDPKKLTAGGVNATTLAFFTLTKELASYFCGNLDSLGGLAPLTQTVGQDKLLSEAASAQLRDMATKTIDAIREVFYSIAWYEWHDPISRRVLEKKVPDTSMSIPVEWNPEDRQGDIDLYDLKIDVYSLQDDSPALKLQKLGAIVVQYVLPLAPFIQQAGGTIDVQAILRDVAKFSDMAEVSDYVTFMDNIDQPSQQPGPPNTMQSGYEDEDQQPPMQQGGQSANDMISQLMAQAGSQTE